MAELLIAFIIAFFVSLFIAFGFRKKHPYGTFWLFFLVIFLTTLAAGFWVRPAGPLFLGFAWIPIFAATLLIAILIAATTKEEPEVPGRQTGELTQEKADTTVRLNVFLWVLIILLAIAVIAGVLVKN